MSHAILLLPKLPTPPMILIFELRIKVVDGRMFIVIFKLYQIKNQNKHGRTSSQSHLRRCFDLTLCRPDSNRGGSNGKPKGALSHGKPAVWLVFFLFIQSRGSKCAPSNKVVNQFTTSFVTRDTRLTQLCTGEIPVEICQLQYSV